MSSVLDGQDVYALLHDPVPGGADPLVGTAREAARQPPANGDPVVPGDHVEHFVPAVGDRGEELLEVRAPLVRNGEVADRAHRGDAPRPPARFRLVEIPAGERVEVAAGDGLSAHDAPPGRSGSPK